MKDERQFANSKGGETRLSRACAVGSDRKSLTVEFVLPPSLAAGLAARYQQRVVRVRPVHQPARAAKAPRGRHSNSHRKPPAAPPTAPHPSRCSSTGGRYRAVTAPLETEPHPAPPATANRLPTALHAAVFGSRQPRSKPNAHLRRNPARDLSQRPESAYEDPLSPTISPTPISAASFRAVASSSPYQRARYSHGARVTPTSAMSCAFSAAVS